MRLGPLGLITTPSQPMCRCYTLSIAPRRRSPTTSKGVWRHSTARSILGICPSPLHCLRLRWTAVGGVYLSTLSLGVLDIVPLRSVCGLYLSMCGAVSTPLPLPSNTAMTVEKRTMSEHRTSFAPHTYGALYAVSYYPPPHLAPPPPCNPPPRGGTVTLTIVFSYALPCSSFAGAPC